MKKVFFSFACIGLGLLLSACSNVHEKLSEAPLYGAEAAAWNVPSMMSMDVSPSEPRNAKSSPASRGIIGTGHGKQVSEKMERVEFVRLSKKQPDSLLIIDYRDEDKVDKGSMARVKVLTDPHGLVGVRFLSDGWFSGAFSTYLTQNNGRPMLLAERGEYYTIELENRTDESLEIVVSVDGLNTTTNSPATYASRGYVLGAKEKAAVRGWHTGWGSNVYRFKFSDIDGTVAAKRQEQETVPDIGTMGFAIFKSKAAANAGSRGRAFTN